MHICCNQFSLLILATRADILQDGMYNRSYFFLCTSLFLLSLLGVNKKEIITREKSIWKSNKCKNVGFFFHFQIKSIVLLFLHFKLSPLLLISHNGKSKIRLKKQSLFRTQGIYWSKPGRKMKKACLFVIALGKFITISVPHTSVLRESSVAEMLSLDIVGHLY